MSGASTSEVEYHPPGVPPPHTNHIIAGIKKAEPRKALPICTSGCATCFVREECLPVNSKLCLISDLAFRWESTVVNAAINIISKDSYRNRCSNHFSPPSADCYRSIITSINPIIFHPSFIQPRQSPCRIPDADQGFRICGCLPGCLSDHYYRLWCSPELYCQPCSLSLLVFM